MAIGPTQVVSAAIKLAELTGQRTGPTWIQSAIIRAGFATPATFGYGPAPQPTVQPTVAVPPPVTAAALKASTPITPYYPTPPTPTSQPMSLLSSNGFDMGGTLLNTIVSGGLQYLTAREQARAQPAIFQQAALPGAGAAAGVLRSLPGAGAVMAGGRALVVGARSVARSAATYCRRNPAWCAQIGGTAAIAGMIQNGQLPPIRRRRGRGISSRDLRAYRRIHNVLAGFCAPKARIRKVC